MGLTADHITILSDQFTKECKPERPKIDFSNIDPVIKKGRKKLPASPSKEFNERKWHGS